MPAPHVHCLPITTTCDERETRVRRRVSNWCWCMWDHPGGLDDHGGLPVGRWDGYSRSWERAVWSCRQQRRPPFVLPRRWLHSRNTVQHSRRQPETVLWQRGVWWIPDSDGMLKFQLSIINRLIHNRLSIMEKFKSSILTYHSVAVWCIVGPTAR